LRGPIEMRCEHYEPVLLQTNDCMYFDSTMKHVMLSASDGDGLILDVCCNASPGPVKELIDLASAKARPAKQRGVSPLGRRASTLVKS
jgi:hypothetical protein